jgi:signal peptidase II
MGRRLYPFVIAAAVFVLDRITKGIIKTRFSPWDTLTVIPGFFNIVHTENPGIAFGMLASAPSFWRDLFLIVFSLTVLTFISVLLLRPARTVGHSRLLKAGLAFILGGALGNLYDRIVNKTVTDFIEVHATISGSAYYFPAFNVADSAITVGACLLLLDMWRTRERKGQAAELRR